MVNRDVREVNYTFTGKLTLFPLTILFLATGAGSLLLFGSKPYSGGYFNSEEVYYGIAGVVLSVVCIMLIVFMVAWLVVKITIQFDYRRNLLVIIKKGVFRSSRLEFILSESTLHYFRTHFSDTHCWLALVVKESNKYYKVFSWRGRGNQRERFLKLFYHLQDELIRCQSLQHQYSQRDNPDRALLVQSGAMYWNRHATEIISKDELVLIGPFTQQLRKLAALQPGGEPSTINDESEFMGDLNAPSQKPSKGKDDKKKGKREKDRQRLYHRPLCIEDLTIINFDSFFQHFRQRKTVSSLHSKRYTHKMV